MLAGGEARLPYLHGKPLLGRRHHVKATSRGAGRANSASLYRMAPVRLHGGKQVGKRVTIVALRECGPVVEGVAARWFCAVGFGRFAGPSPDLRAASHEPGAQLGLPS
jgi:hypothetical protein